MIDITLAIDSTGSYMTITASVKTDSYYTDVYIDKISIDTQDTYIENGPSTTPIYTQTITGSQKSISITLDTNDFTQSMNSNMFFVYVKSKGTPTSDVPCGADVVTSVGVVYNNYPIFQRGMKYIKEILNPKNIEKAFIDFILQIKALELSIITSNYTISVYYWNKFFKDNVYINNECRCNHG